MIKKRIEQDQQEQQVVASQPNETSKRSQFKQMKADSKLEQQLQQDQMQGSEIITKVIYQFNPLILNHVCKEFERQVSFHKNITWIIDQCTIVIKGLADEVNAASIWLMDSFKDLESRYVRLKVLVNQSQVDLTDQEILFFQKKLLKDKQQIESSEVCLINIETNTNLQSQIMLTLQYKNKILIILHGDILDFQANAIVNFTNSQLNGNDLMVHTENSFKVMRLGSVNYQNACKQFIQQNKRLKDLEVFVYQSNGNFIFTIATPKANTNDSIHNTIQSILAKANELKIEEITLTIPDQSKQYKTMVQQFITAILGYLYQNNKSLQRINLVELSEQKINKITEIANALVKATPPARQAKHQWTWYDNNIPKQYEKDTNDQIDLAYEQFLSDSQKNIFKLKFPHTKRPATHIVDLQNNLIHDMDLKTTQPLIQDQTLGYLINNTPVDPLLNAYLISNKAQMTVYVEIFWKQYSIYFVGQQVYQINDVTKYQRLVTKAALQSLNQIPSNFCQQFQLKQFPFNTQAQNSLSVGLLDQTKFEQISTRIVTLIKSKQIQLQITVPYIKEPHLQNLLQFIKKNTLQISGQLEVNQQAWITAFTNKVEKIRQQLVCENLLKFPKEWQHQDKNLLKVPINSNEPEFKKINDLFMDQNPGAKIFRIYRIQNKLLWENYIIARNKILEYYMRYNIKLEDWETSMYSWHGVKLEHPKVIYEGELKAFDTTYSKDESLWGRAIYFASQAKYSRSFSYKLLPNEEPGCEGKLIFLCCIVTAGKTYFSPVKYEVKRPPQGYSCVSAVNNGTRVYALYDMDVHRAYPAYEVIYE